MDARHFDALARALTDAGSRRSLLGLLAAIPILGGLFAFFDAENGADAKGRRQRRKKRHKHGKGRRHTGKRKGNKTCKPQPKEKTCAGKCGSVPNNCKQAVDCGPCTCDPPCGACERCAGTTCEPCAPCCNDICCPDANAICHASSGACCVPDAKAATCDGKCGPVVNTCGVTVACGSCVCDPVCPTCQICDEATGACDADPEQDGDPCGPAQSCDQGTTAPRGSCNASGTCVAADPVSCDPYALCDGNVCATTCGDDDDCVPGAFCDGSAQCVAKYQWGLSCDRNSECQSGSCVDSVCCNSACDPACHTCAAPSFWGSCLPRTSGTPCGSGQICCCGACQAGSACGTGAAFGEACTSDGECASGLCGCPASDCAGGGICVDRRDCDPVGCLRGGQGSYAIIHAGGGGQLTCGLQAAGGGCPCPAGQVCHLTASLCVIPYDVPVVTTPA